MSSDPYLLVQREVESALQAASQHLRTFRSPQASSDDREWSKEELKGTLAALEGDVQELQDTVLAVQEDPSRFGLTASEVDARRQFIERARGEIQKIRNALPVEGSSRWPATQHAQRINADQQQYRDDPQDDDDLPQGFVAQQQQHYMESQDKMLDTIGNTVSTLKAQAGLMGREVWEQVDMLEDLESGVDRSQTRLTRATKQMHAFIEQNKKSGSSWTIFLLTIVLALLLLLIILL